MKTEPDSRADRDEREVELHVARALYEGHEGRSKTLSFGTQKPLFETRKIPPSRRAVERTLFGTPAPSRRLRSALDRQGEDREPTAGRAADRLDARLHTLREGTF